MYLNLDFRLSNQKLLVTSFIKVRKEKFFLSKQNICIKVNDIS